MCSRSVDITPVSSETLESLYTFSVSVMVDSSTLITTSGRSGFSSPGRVTPGFTERSSGPTPPSMTRGPWIRFRVWDISGKDFSKLFSVGAPSVATTVISAATFQSASVKVTVPSVELKRASALETTVCPSVRIFTVTVVPAAGAFVRTML